MTEKRKIRFNIIDFIILVAVIACVVGIALRYDVADRIGVKTNETKVEISFIVHDIKESSADALLIGDEFYWKQNGMSLGTLIEKEIAPAERISENGRGEGVVTYSENKKDARATLVAVGTVTDDGFMLGGTQFISAGKEMEIYSKQVEVLAIITDVTVIN